MYTLTSPQTNALQTSPHWIIVYERGRSFVSRQDNRDIWNICDPCSVHKANAIIKKERKPRLGKGAKITKRLSTIPLLWSVDFPLISKNYRLDLGNSRTRGGKFRNFFKRIKHTVGRRKFSLGVG